MDMTTMGTTPECDAAKQDPAPRRRKRIALEHQRGSGDAEEIDDRLEESRS
jgi:hypothetical protein